MRPEALAPVSSEDARALLDSLKTADPGQRASLGFFAAPHRGAALALMAFGAEVRALPSRVSETMLGAIRLQWWREALDEVYGAARPRQHPLVTALAASIATEPSVEPILRDMLDRNAVLLEPGDLGSAEEAIALFDIVEGGRTRALLRLTGAPERAEAPLSKAAACAGILNALRRPHPPSAATAPVIETAAGRLHRAAEKGVIVEEARAALRESLALVPVLPAASAPILGPIKAAGASRGDPGPARVSAATMLAVLRGR